MLFRSRVGVSIRAVVTVGVGVFVVNLALIAAGIVGAPTLQWTLFVYSAAASILSYPIVSAQFPIDYAGRVNTALNLVTFVVAFGLQAGVGVALELLADQGIAPAHGHQVILGVLLIVSLASLIWFLLPRRPASLDSTPASR